ncbi:hypothetical protein Rwratislav_10383 [Rhodococcus wratislaviensis IFP 2016]|nr:hypothetical protein Rwratislav_10383 [Rhodococcus wratislaviensis IFP 2016]
MIVVADDLDIGARSEVGALLEAHEDLLVFLTEQDADPDRGVWRSQLQRLATRYVQSAAALRDAGMSVDLTDGDTSRGQDNRQRPPGILLTSMWRFQA